MGEIIGYVTRTLGAPFQNLSGLSARGAPAIARNQFIASRKNGVIIGDALDGVRAAQRALENADGGDPLVWAQEGNNNAIERWVGRSTFFYPGDFGSLLSGWWRADQGLRLRPTSPAAVSFRTSLWGSFDGSGTVRATPPTVGAQPLYVAEALGGRPALLFATAGGDYLTTNLSLAAPYAVFALATYQPAGREQLVIQNSQGVRMGVTAGGDWFVEGSGGTLVGDVASAGQAAVIGATVSAAGVLEGFFNFTSLGTAAQAAAAATWTISDVTSSWATDIEDIVIVADDINATWRARLKQYFDRRYLRTF